MRARECACAAGSSASAICRKSRLRRRLRWRSYGRLVSGRFLQEHGLDALHRRLLVDALDRRDLARHAGEGGFIQLSLGIGLLRLATRTMKVADHFRDRDKIAGVDLGLVL